LKSFLSHSLSLFLFRFGSVQRAAAPLPASSARADDHLSVAVDNADHLSRPLYLPGRIFHVLPVARRRLASSLSSASASSCCGEDEQRVVVYPASARSFQEMVVSSHMFIDHMPYKYSV
jgi:hypothetical protein